MKKNDIEKMNLFLAEQKEQEKLHEKMLEERLLENMPQKARNLLPDFLRPYAEWLGQSPSSKRLVFFKIDLGRQGHLTCRVDLLSNTVSYQYGYRSSITGNKVYPSIEADESSDFTDDLAFALQAAIDCEASWQRRNHQSPSKL